jgi:hypothetical protein
MKLKEKLLSQFEPDIARQLLAFGEHLSSIDADVVMFLARKSLRLYDLLLKLGVSPIEQCVVSDRLLDMSLAPLRGKRVALVDDTLIVGTTLAKTKKILEQAGATVTTHVFCLDEKWYCKDLISPDHTSVRLSDDRLMTFCSAEVRALSLVPLPYLVDFPLIRPLRLRPDEQHRMLNSAEWNAMKLSTQLQEEHSISAFTFFPSDALAAELEKLFGPNLYKCLDLLKVRGWSRRRRDSWIIQLVPIATLGPLEETGLSDLTDGLLASVLGESAGEMQTMFAFPRARHRLCQFIISAALGSRFMDGVQERIGRKLRWQFDDNETDRHYGPWLHDKTSALAQNAYAGLSSEDHPGQVGLRRAQIPTSTLDWAAASIGVGRTKGGLQRKRSRQPRTNLLSDFAEIFHSIYDNREIPARKEARELGRDYVANVSATTHLSRLERGIPWQVLVDWMAGLWKVEKSMWVTNTFSLLLDLCNDVGIAVPVTCVDGRVIYRGYRHGEDVKFSDNELALAYDAAEGFLQTSGLQSIPRLTLEKLLVLLIKIGASHGFLEVLYGASGTDGVCKVGFDLKGARPLYSRGPTQRAERDLWLTDYLIERGVLRALPKKGKPKGQYVLGKRPSGNYSRSRSPDEAKDLGNVVGMLTRLKRGQPPVLDEGAITLLTTCSTPSDTAKALQVELAIFRDWFQSKGQTLISQTDLTDAEAIIASLRSLSTSFGYEAIQAARFKFVGYKTEQPSAIIEAAQIGLSQEPEIYGRRWHSYWSPLEKAKLIAEKQQFEDLIEQAASLCWQIAACMGIVEIGLCYQLFQLNPATEKRLNSAFMKLQNYRTAMRSVGLSEPTRAAKIADRFRQITGLKQIEFRFEDREMILETKDRPFSPFNPKVAFDYAFQELTKLCADMDSLVDLIDALHTGFGKLSDRVDYSHMVYYDIIDSTATHAGRQGANVEYHRNSVMQLKQHLNRWFDRSMGEAQRRSDEIVCINGTKNSTNDCKHVFFRGVNSRLWAERVITVVAKAAATFQMCARIYVVPCAFVGSSAYRRGFDPEIKGMRFWEHWSRLAKQASLFEPQPPSGNSFLLVATEELIKTVRLDDSLEWTDQKEDSVKSEIELLSRQTTVRYGQLGLVNQTANPRLNPASV